MEPLIVAFIGYILGALSRTAYDFLWKLLEDSDIKWDQKYTVTFLLSVIVSFVSAVATFTTISIPLDVASQYTIIMLCFGQGFAINHLINKPVAYAMSRRTNGSAPAPP